MFTAEKRVSAGRAPRATTGVNVSGKRASWHPRPVELLNDMPEKSAYLARSSSFNASS